MPWDVSIQWNPTYDMVRFVTIYHEPIGKITDKCSMKLHDYEIKDYEWKTVEELQDCLKVSFFFHFFYFSLTSFLFFCRYSKP